MDSDFDEFDEEVEEFEEEEEEKTKKTKPKKKVSVKETKEPTERYEAFYVRPRIGIVDTLTGDVVVEGLSDVSIAQLEAYKLNRLDKIGIASGAQ